MTPKTIIIHHCDDCPFFDNAYPHHKEQCEKTGRFVLSVWLEHAIPDWCPLGDVTDMQKEHEVTG